MKILKSFSKLCSNNVSKLCDGTAKFLSIKTILRNCDTTEKLRVPKKSQFIDWTPKRVFNLYLTRLAIVLNIIKVVSLKQRDIKVTHSPSTRAYGMRITRLGII